MAAFATAGVEHHSHSQAGPVLALPEAAQAGRQPLGQHRLHPVGKIDAVAFLPRNSVQLGAGPDVGGDIGDSDPGDPATGVLRVVVRLGKDRVIVIAGVLRVDGDQRDVAHVLAPAQGRRLGLFRLGFGGGREAHRNAVGVDGDQRGGARLILAAHDLQKLAVLWPKAAAVALYRGQYQIAVLHVLAGRQQQAVFRAPIHRLDPDLATHLADHAQNAVRALTQPLDQLGLKLAGFQLVEPHQQSVAHARRAGSGFLAGGQCHDRRFLALDQFHQQFAVGVLAHHVDDADLGKGSSLGEPAPAALAQRALGL